MYFLGVDGGQSSTTAVIGDERGRVLGRGEAGPCNHVESETGREKLVAAVSESIAAAARAAGLQPPEEYDAACFGMSGGAADKRELIASIVKANRLEVTHDAHIALLGATAGEPGIIVIAGTGSIAYGRNREGRTARAGGWGHIFGDEGGGFDIVRQALRAALRQEEGWGPATSLGRRLMEAAGAATVNDVLHLLYTRDFPRDRVAGWAPLVDAAAAEGDAVARSLLQQAAQQLATLAGSVRSQLFAPGDPVYVAAIGGVFQSQTLAEWVRILVELEPGATVGPPRHDPATGALLGAWLSAGVAVTLREAR
ncbi:MAG TPA: BadF/BadG/BcrA/BcrD ATPase family protein [Bryobacterales bacterium]|nr:BadF/BadG/BcrA/BcrD ATPase family protein [Bryobacterales bacterium]